MSRFSGQQYKGAQKDVKKERRLQAEWRAARFELLKNLTPRERLLTAIFGVNWNRFIRFDKNMDHMRHVHMTLHRSFK